MMSANPARIDVCVERSVHRRRIDVHLLASSSTGNTLVARPFTFERLDEGAVAPPALSLLPEDAQLLMDELWRAGLRPTEGTGSAGSLAATERHLRDMRDIAMGLLKGEM